MASVTKNVLYKPKMISQNTKNDSAPLNMAKCY